jgi:amino acid transporter
MSHNGSNSGKLSLSSAILVNLNIMVGSGIFVNTVLLSQNAGGLGAAAYVAVGLLILPLILSISKLAFLHRGGNFYDYGANISHYVGFVTGLSYFIAKLSSCALAIHVCMSLLKTIFVPLRSVPTLALDIPFVILFGVLNTFNLHVGKRIQFFFMGCKFVPIFFVLFTGLYLFNPANFSSTNLYPLGVLTSVPFILYAFMGFEASCSLSKSIENPEKNGPRAMLIAYALGIMAVCLFQFFFYGSLGLELGKLTSYLQAFPALLKALSISAETQEYLKIVLHLGIASSVLGAAYSIMYSNSWNLFELAIRGHVVRQDLFTWRNAHNIPVFCVAIEALIVITYLLLTQGEQVPLQQVSSFGSTIAYTLCALGLIVITYKNSGRLQIMPVLGAMSCLLLICALMKNFMTYGAVPALIFLMVLLMLSFMYRRHNSIHINGF